MSQLSQKTVKVRECWVFILCKMLVFLVLTAALMCFLCYFREIFE